MYFYHQSETSRYRSVRLPSLSYLIVLTWLWAVGNLAFISDKSKELTLHVHDECNGSDVFGSDICNILSMLSKNVIGVLSDVESGLWFISERKEELWVK